jgi:hypothetical protein
MADKHWIRDLNGYSVVVIDFVGADHVKVRIGNDIDVWPISFWRSLPIWSGAYV